MSDPTTVVDFLADALAELVAAARDAAAGVAPTGESSIGRLRRFLDTHYPEEASSAADPGALLARIIGSGVPIFAGEGWTISRYRRKQPALLLWSDGMTALSVPVTDEEIALLASLGVRDGSDTRPT